MKTYDKYKSSGIDWIGDIPEHWELKRLKFFAKVNSPISSFEIDKSSDSEVDDFARIFYQPSVISNAREQGKLYSSIAPAIDRFKDIEDEDTKDEFKNSLISFVRLYSFLSQIMPFQDVELEKLYSFGRFLLPKLPKTDYTDQLKLDNEVALEYYRLQKLGDGDLVLEIQGEHALTRTTEAGIKRAEDEKARLSDIITRLNTKFGTDFNEADKLFFD